VGKIIIHECLNGYLKDKTRILITHALNYCQYSDYVYLMENGMVKDQGTFADIRKTKTFNDIYNKFFKDSQREEKEEDIEDILEEHKLVVTFNIRVGTIEEEVVSASIGEGPL
jgi:ABC-type transport system involved in cytochrome bd biosynthesis fused ATPase/permease subunit